MTQILDPLDSRMLHSYPKALPLLLSQGSAVEIPLSYRFTRSVTTS